MSGEAATLPSHLEHAIGLGHIVIEVHRWREKHPERCDRRIHVTVHPDGPAVGPELHGLALALDIDLDVVESILVDLKGSEPDQPLRPGQIFITWSHEEDGDGWGMDDD